MERFDFKDQKEYNHQRGIWAYEKGTIEGEMKSYYDALKDSSDLHRVMERLKQEYNAVDAEIEQARLDNPQFLI